MSRHTIVFIATLILSVSSRTVSAAPVRFIPMNDDVAACKIAFQDDKGLTNLKDLNSQKRSAPYNFKSSGKSIKLVAVDRKGDDGKPPTLELPIASEFKSPLVLILADPKHPTGWGAVAIEDSSAGFAWGTLRFLNLTDGPLMLRYGTETKPLPDGNQPVDVLPGGEAHNIGVQLFNESAPGNILYSAAWEHDPAFRKLIVIMPGVDPRIRVLDLKVLPDKRPAGK